jgi:hypothetical protein
MDYMTDRSQSTSSTKLQKKSVQMTAGKAAMCYVEEEDGKEKVEVKGRHVNCLADIQKPFRFVRPDA